MIQRARKFLKETRGRVESKILHDELITGGYNVSPETVASALSTARREVEVARMGTLGGTEVSEKTVPSEVSLLRLFANPNISHLYLRALLTGAEPVDVFRSFRDDDDFTPGKIASDWLKGEIDGGIGYRVFQGSRYVIIGGKDAAREWSKVKTAYYDTVFNAEEGDRNANVGVLARVDPATGLSVPVYVIVFSNSKATTLMSALAEIKQILEAEGFNINVEVLKHGESHFNTTYFLCPLPSYVLITLPFLSSPPNPFTILIPSSDNCYVSVLLHMSGFL